MINLHKHKDVVPVLNQVTVADSNCDVSVIMPTFESAATIPRAIESVLGQRCQPSELIIVDDGSTDETAVVIDQVLAASCEMKVIRLQTSNKGAAAARNIGMDRATGKYLAFLDADDEWYSDKLLDSMQAILSNNLSMVAHNYWLERGGKAEWIDCAARFKEHRDPWVGLYRKGYIATSTVVVRRDLVAKARGFDETLRNAHDFDLWLRILDKPKVRFSVLQCGHALCHIVEGSVTSYTSRRLNCGMAVARRNILGLWNRSVFQVGNYFYRLTAIHMEAFWAHNKRGEFGAALSVLLRLGGRIFIGPIEVVSALGCGVTDQLEISEAGGSDHARSPVDKYARFVVPTLLWLLVIAGFCLYSLQYADIIGAILDMLKRLI